MALEDLAKLFILVYVGLLLLADAALEVIRPDAMWSVQLQRGDLRVGALVVVAFVLFGAHLVDQMRHWWA